MAKAKEIDGLDCAADALFWAAEVLRVRFDEIAERRQTALDFSDIEGVHNMRVATRRLRSALRDFEPLVKKRLPKKLRKDLKQVADALGAVRDQDVAIEFLEKLSAETDAEAIKTGIGRFIEERAAIRADAREDLLEIIAADEIDDLRNRFAAAIDKMARRRKAKQSHSFSDAGQAAILEGLENLFDLGAHLYHPFNVTELHEMRIAAKRLRYAIELFIHCWGDAIAPFAESIAAMQSFLGEAHDCDIWIEDLGKKLAQTQEHAADEADEYQTAVWLLSEFVKKRFKEYRSALQLWSEWEANRFADRMRTIIEAA